MKWARSIHRISSQSNPDGFEPNWIAKCMHTQWISIGLGYEKYHFLFSSCRIRFSYDAPLPIFLTRYLTYLSCLLLPGYLFCHVFFTEIDLIPLMAQAKNIEFELTHNSTLSCIRVRTLMKLFFFFSYTKMTFPIVNPSERWFIKPTLHFLLTTQLTSPIKQSIQLMTQLLLPRNNSINSNLSGFRIYRFKSTHGSSGNPYDSNRLKSEPYYVWKW